MSLQELLGFEQIDQAAIAEVILRERLFPDVPGEDRPETVEAIRQSDERWLNQAEENGFGAAIVGMSDCVSKE